MKIILITAFLAWAATANALDIAPWRWTQPFEVTKPGIIRLELPPDVIGASRSGLQDVRLLSPAENETPYVVEPVVINPPRRTDVQHLRMSLVEQTTVVEIDTGTSSPIEALIVTTNARDFLKAARLEGSSDDGAPWKELAPREVLFQKPQGEDRLRIPFASGSWKKLRLTLDDRRTQPIAIVAAQVQFTAQPVTTLPHDTKLVQTEEKPRETRLVVDLGQPNLQIATITLKVDDAVFSRRVRVLQVASTPTGELETQVASGTIYRVTTGDGPTAEDLVIAAHKTLASSKIILSVDNGDSPPLRVSGIEVRRHPASLLFFADAAGSWRLITGHAKISEPVYDVAQLKQEVTHASSIVLPSHSLAANTGFVQPADLPEISPQGATVDTSAWGYRRPVEFEGVGIHRLDLDAPTLAHSQFSLADLRLVQGDKQIPYLVERSDRTQVIDATIQVDNDAKRPTVSIWKVQPAVSGTPLASMTLTSSTPLFERTLRLWHSHKDEFGRSSQLYLGSATWTRSGPGAKADLQMEMNSQRAPETFFIETDNGDNPPIAIDGIKLHHRVVSLVTKVTDPAPVFLYYGNNRASEPRYDLQLVRREMMQATTKPATLGGEQVLQAKKPKVHDRPEAGSPWLWVALSVMIGGLLWVIARMLPKAETPPS